MNKTKLLISGFALAALGAGVSACGPDVASQAGPKAHGPAAPVTAADVGTGMGSGVTMSGGGISTGPGAYVLQPMPVGTVSFRRGAQGHLLAHIVMFGLTPGSAHDAVIAGLGSSVRFPALTADAVGQVNTTLASMGSVGRLAPLSEFIIKLGTAGSGRLAAEPIAETGPLAAHPASARGFTFHAVSAGGGRATITFNAAAQTLAVTVTAYGLTPGPHAAHIHLGSCQSQGGVKYGLADFIADRNGNVIGQTRLVTGVASVPGPGNWYLNLHLGGMNEILANGAPTLYFRPMLCANITTFATPGAGGATPSASPSASASATSSPMSTPSMTTLPTTFPSSTPTPAATATPSASPSPAPRTTPSPTNQPTHW